MSRIRRHLTFANVASAIALFVALSGGTAVALSGANTVFTDDIVNDQVYSGDVRNDSLTGGGLAAADLKPSSVGTSEVALNSLGAGDLAPGSVGTSEVANGSIGSDDLAPAALGARAYGRVLTGGSFGRSKNVTSVSHTADTGVYCITLAAGIDPATAVLIAEPEFSEDFTSLNFDNVSVVEWNAGGGNCNPPALEVDTFLYNGDSTDNDHDLAGTGDTTGDDLLQFDQSFAFVVP